MTWTRILGGPLWFQWARTVVFLLLFAEYLRLVTTTDAASYRVVVTALWGVIAIASLIALVREIRRRSGPDNT
jgi:hypothetical protein